MPKIFKLLFHRVVLVSFSILLQLAVIIVVLFRFRGQFAWVYAASVGLGIVVVCAIVSKRTNPAYKMAWIIPILALPVFGIAFYLLFGGNRLSNRQKRRMNSMERMMREGLRQDPDVTARLRAREPLASAQAAYILRASACPVYENTETDYFPTGDACFPRMVEELKKAKRYIFLEYFIIGEGYMWSTILRVLRERVASGIDVRLIFDDFGSILSLPYGYEKKLEAMGIKCCVFNPYLPVLSSRLNNRDHRKLMIIDGIVGFTGGINLADEYINRRVRFGHWKDCGILLRGDAVWSMTVMFLSMWEYARGTHETLDAYRPPLLESGEHGYVQPYTDNPLDYEPVGENVYLNLINKARRHVYIMTPYLIIDNEMITALTTAAKSGLDVRILTPHIPDKKMVFALTRAYYEMLIESGVRIFEYTPGFVHSKAFAVDGVYATVGTVNLDFRSLYLHFENGVWMYGADCVADVERDFDEAFGCSGEITLSMCRATKWPQRVGRAVLRVFAPVL